MVIFYNNKPYIYLNYLVNQSAEINLQCPDPNYQSWKPCLIDSKCFCSELLAIQKKYRKKKRKRKGLSEGKSVIYPLPIVNGDKIMTKTFQIKYENTLSTLTKSILQTCQNKYIYYCMDDIQLIKDVNERETLLTFIFSSMLSLHNDFSVNFFDIWIDRIYINSIPKNNRFLIKKNQNLPEFTYIQLTLYYKIRLPMKKPEPLW